LESKRWTIPGFFGLGAAVSPTSTDNLSDISSSRQIRSLLYLEIAGDEFPEKKKNQDRQNYNNCRLQITHFEPPFGSDESGLSIIYPPFGEREKLSGFLGVCSPTNRQQKWGERWVSKRLFIPSARKTSTLGVDKQCLPCIFLC
jgi:hypothetical protein